MHRLSLMILVLLWAFSNACVPPHPDDSYDRLRQSAIYGSDDRQYTDSHPDATLRKLAEAVALFISYSRVNIDSMTKEVTLDGDPLTTKIEKSSDYDQKPLCLSEPFRLDHAPGSCTGFLIGPKLMATAGHCVGSVENLSVQAAQSWCNLRAFVFGFKKGRVLQESDVYRCRRVLVHGYSTSPKLDYALIELRTPVQGVTPLAFEAKPNLTKGDAIAVIGHPHGTYQKIAAGAVVNDPRTTDLDYFTSTLDTMPGNSGSPVFSTQSYKAIGIHVRGARPVYEVDTANNCNKSNVISDGIGKQSENYLNRIEGEICKVDSDCPKTHLCEQGRCHFRTVDLQYTDAKISQDSGQLGDKVKIDVTIKNVGNIDVSSDFRLGVWWSSNDSICVTCGQDQELAAQVIQGGLAVGATVTRSFLIEIKSPFQAGKQFIGLQIDDLIASTKKYSFYGDVAESDEDNNERTFPFTLNDGCKSDCTQEGARRCAGADIQTCSTTGGTCLAWQTTRTCDIRETCASGICKKDCTDLCSAVEAPRCKANGIERCLEAVNGCLAWTLTTACSSEGESCEDGVCVKKRRADGQSCSTDTDCNSQRCRKQADGKQICMASCTKHADCKEKSAPFCLDGACLSIPKEACLVAADCGDTGAYKCQDSRCLRTPGRVPLPNLESVIEPSPDAGPTPIPEAPRPPTGCGCSLQREGAPTGQLWWLGFVLLGFWLRRQLS